MENNKVLAKVATREITQENLNFFLKSLNPQVAAQFYSEEGQKQLLDEMINQELLYLDALDKGLEKHEAYQVEVENLKENLLKQYAVNQLLKDIQVSDQEVEGFYQDNKDQFVSPKSIKASHILVDDKDHADQIIKEIEEGLSFEEAAQKYSNCPSKEKGGDLGFFSKGQMVPEFEEAAFNMELNKVSQPIKSEFGYHIIKVNEEKEEGSKSLDEVKSQIQNQLTSQKQQAVYFEKVEGLKDKYKVEM